MKSGEQEQQQQQRGGSTRWPFGRNGAGGMQSSSFKVLPIVGYLRCLDVFDLISASHSPNRGC
jgi:hypothetical protein